MLERLEEHTHATTASDAALIVSELVTNSVVHANVGHGQVVILELTELADRLRVAVTDGGSEDEPRLLPVDVTTPGGYGLRLIDDMACAWGIRRSSGGTTRVWCELPLTPPPL